MDAKFCPKCKTGAKSYKLDPKSPMCPYLQFHNGTICTFFTVMTEREVMDDERVRGNNNRNPPKDSFY